MIHDEGWDGTTFRTHNMILAALLVEFGYEIRTIEATTDRLRMFVLEGDRRMEVLIEDFWRNEKFQLNPRGFISTINDIKSQILTRKAV